MYISDHSKDDRYIDCSDIFTTGNNFHEPVYMYSKAEILSLRQKQNNISDQQYDRIKELRIAKRRRGRRAGNHTSKEIKVNITYRDYQHRNYSNQVPRTRVLSSVPRVLRNPQ